MSKNFTPEQRQQLAKYVTNTDGDVFAVTNLDRLAGAIFARYSRAQGGFREVLLREFLSEDGSINEAKVHGLIERVLIAFGDDSVGELAGAHLALEGISVRATKEFEDRRIGGSPIEQSTRYVFYDIREDASGNWRYHRPQAVLASPHGAAYVETMDFIFDTYASLVEPMKAFYMERHPLEDAAYDVVGDGTKRRLAELTDEKHRKAFSLTYTSDIRTKACDTLRSLLPLATLTNVGFFGNGRFYQHALTHAFTSPIDEVRGIAERAKRELAKVIPHYVKRAQPNGYAAENHAAMAALAKELFDGIAPEEAPEVDLLDRGGEAIAKALEAGTAIHPQAVEQAMLDEEDNLLMAQMLYPHLDHPLRQIRAVVRGMTPEAKIRLRATYAGTRRTRRDRPGRALESGYPYTFDLVTDFGTYKDLERHRMLTQQRQRWTPDFGFSMPPDLVVAGFEAQARACVEKAVALHARLAQEFPEEAAYATLHGSLVRWTVGINDRALMHLIELRTTPQGHPSYRRTAQAMHHAVAARSPWRAEAMTFADHHDYASARGDSEARQRVKEAALDAKSEA